MDIRLGKKTIAIRDITTSLSDILSNEFRYCAPDYEERVSKDDLSVIHPHIKRN